jgi:gliding motility-associated-like protein
MKISPDGSKLVSCNTFQRTAELFDFNAATGEVSNAVVVSDENMSVYGAEFSTNSDVLYVSTVDEKKLLQFNLRADNVPASKIVVATLSATLGALQLGPNGKIYLAMAETNHLSEIESPDHIGSSCNLVPFAITLDGLCMLGLPSFNASFFDHSIKVENICASSTSEFSVSTGQEITSIVWNFGDNATSTDINPSHTYAAAGDYLVTAIATNSNCTITKSRLVTIIAAPVVNAIPNQNLCIAAGEPYHLFDNNAAILNGQTSSVSINYYSSQENAENNNSPLSDLQTLQPGTITYYIKATNEITGCAAFGSFSLSAYLQPGAMQPTDYIICEDAPYDGYDSFDLNIKDAEILGGQDPAQYSVSYHHSEADAEQGINPIGSPYTNSSTEETLFARVINAGACYFVVPLELILTQQPKGIEISDYVACEQAPTDGFFMFDLNSKDQEALADFPAPDFAVTYYTRYEDAVAGTSPVSGMFTNSVIGQEIYARVESVTGGCMYITSFHLDVKECNVTPQPPVAEVLPFSFPKFFTPNSDGFNDLWQISYAEATSVEISIFDRNGRLVTKMSGGSRGWDGKVDGNPLPSSDYWFIATGNGLNQRGHFSLVY